MDLDAFDQIMRLYQRQVLMTAFRILGNMPDAQDASQEVFFRLFRYASRVDAGRDLKPWLYRMTVNVCFDLRRRPAPHIKGAVSATPLIEDALDLETRKELIRRALRQLPERERTAVVLRDIEGLSTLEVARAMGSSEGTVRSQVSAARAKLRTLCEGLMRRRA